MTATIIAMNTTSTTAAKLAELKAQQAELAAQMKALTKSALAEEMKAQKAAQKAADAAAIEKATRRAARIAKMMKAQPKLTLAMIGEQLAELNRKENRKEHVRLTDKNIEQCMAMFNAGLPIATIAAQMPCSAPTVYKLFEGKTPAVKLTVGEWFTGKKGPVPSAAQAKIDEIVKSIMGEVVGEVESVNVH